MSCWMSGVCSPAVFLFKRIWYCGVSLLLIWEGESGWGRAEWRHWSRSCLYMLVEKSSLTSLSRKSRCMSDLMKNPPTPCNSVIKSLIWVVIPHPHMAGMLFVKQNSQMTAGTAVLSWLLLWGDRVSYESVMKGLSWSVCWMHCHNCVFIIMLMSFRVQQLATNALCANEK